jgi:hypothetical protein
LPYFVISASELHKLQALKQFLLFPPLPKGSAGGEENKDWASAIKTRLRPYGFTFYFFKRR